MISSCVSRITSSVRNSEYGYFICKKQSVIMISSSVSRITSSVRNTVSMVTSPVRNSE